MTLLDRFRRRPDWEHPDAEVRAEAVRHIPMPEQELLDRIAGTDADARVRRAAVRRLRAAASLVARLQDADPGVREEAAAALLAKALGEDAPEAEAAVPALAESRHLVQVARSAARPAVRGLAVARLGDARSLALLARTAADPAVRAAALGRVDDTALLVEIACKSEHKDVAMEAVDRLREDEALQTIVAKGKNKAAVRRARARLEPDAAPEAPAEAPPEAPEAEVEAASAPGASMVEEPVPGPEPVASAPEPMPAAAPAAVAAAEPEPEPVAPQPAPIPVAEAAPVAKLSDEERRAHADAQRAAEEQRRKAVAAAEALLARLEALVANQATGLREADSGLREARTALESAANLPSKLGQKLKAVRATLFARAQELREADEWSRWGNATAQEELCKRMEALVPRADLEKVARELHECDLKWAAVKAAPRDQAEPLRQRYQAARGQVKARTDAYFAEKSRKESQNLEAKQELVTQAEALAESTDWIKAADALKALQARWKEVGPVPHRKSEAVWKRFRTACDRFFTRRHEDLKHRKEEWGKNLASKEALCVRAEALAQSSDWEAAAAEVRKLQLEWKSVGPVKRSRSEEIWQRFRTACDAFFERYKNRDSLALAARAAEREALVAEVEALVPAGEAAAAPEGLADSVQRIQGRLRQAAPLPAEQEQALQARFSQARSRLLETWPASFRGSELDPEANRTKKEKLLARVELLVAGAVKASAPLTGDELARRLKEALATNTIAGSAEVEARRRAEVEEVTSAQAAWKRLGPVPGEAGAALDERFEKACAQFFSAQPPPPRPRRAAAAR